MERSLQIFKAESGPDGFKVGSVLTSLGHAEWVLNNLTQAKSYLESALKIKAEYYQTEHIAIAISLNNLGNVYKDLGNTTESISCLEKALKISEQHYGKNHLSTAIILNNLAAVYQIIQKNSQAQDLLAFTREIKKSYQLGESPLNFGTAYGVLGDVNHKK